MAEEDEALQKFLKEQLEKGYIQKSKSVTFGLNVQLDLSWKATTKSLCLLGTEFVLQVLGESNRVVAIRVIRGDEGVGDIPGI